MKKTVATLHILKGKALWVILTLVVVVGGVVWYRSSSSGAQYETVDVVLGDVVEKVIVTGKVAPFAKADLGFEKGGILATKQVKVGDVVAQGQVIASLDIGEAIATLGSAQAKLSELEGGLRPEEYVVEERKVTSSQISYDEARKDVVNGIREAYIKADGAVRNYTDTFFSGAQTANPDFMLRTESLELEKSLNENRILIGDRLALWKNESDKLNTSFSTSTDLEPFLKSAHGHLTVMKSFFDRLLSVVSSISTANSGTSQSTIDGYNSTINTAYTSLNSAVATLSTVESAYRTATTNLSLAEDQFVLKKAGSTAEAIQAQRATVAGFQSALSKARIVSPIAGIVTKAEPEVGEFVSSGEIVFAVMSNESFKVEVFVPESDIAKVGVGNTASITLDAYSDEDVFGATVTLVDPAETIVEGIPTYKVTLRFNEKDARIRSGMTANITLTTQNAEDVQVIPSRAVGEKNGVRTVRVLNGDGTVTSRTITTGLKGSNGMIEVKSGLNIGDKVVVSEK